MGPREGAGGGDEPQRGRRIGAHVVIGVRAVDEDETRLALVRRPVERRRIAEELRDAARRRWRRAEPRAGRRLLDILLLAGREREAPRMLRRQVEREDRGRRRRVERQIDGRAAVERPDPYALAAGPHA